MSVPHFLSSIKMTCCKFCLNEKILRYLTYDPFLSFDHPGFLSLSSLVPKTAMSWVRICPKKIVHEAYKGHIAPSFNEIYFFEVFFVHFLGKLTVFFVQLLVWVVALVEAKQTELFVVLLSVCLARLVWQYLLSFPP